MQSASLVRNAAHWFVSGCSITIGALVVVVGYVLLIQPLLAKVTDEQKTTEFTLNTGQLLVEKIEPFVVTKQAGVRAIIRNTGTLVSRPDRVTLTIFQGANVLFVCQVSAGSFIKPGESVTEQLLCPEVERASVPADASYSLKIAGTWNSN